MSIQDPKMSVKDSASVDPSVGRMLDPVEGGEFTLPPTPLPAGLPSGRMPKSALLSRVLRQNQQNCAFRLGPRAASRLLWDLGTDLPRILRAFRTLCPVCYVFLHNLSRILRAFHTPLPNIQKNVHRGLPPTLSRILRVFAQFVT